MLIVIITAICFLDRCTIKLKYNDKLQMVGEIINFDLYKEKSDIMVNFDLKSYYEISYDLGLRFPVDGYLSYSDYTGYMPHFPVSDFKAYYEGDEIISTKTLDEYKHPLSGENHEAYWYKYDLFFPSNEIIESSVEYTIPSIFHPSINAESFSEYNRMSHYVIHTGRYWNDTIEEMTIKILINESQIDNDILLLINGESIELKGETSYEIMFNDMELSEDIFIFYNISN
jgi:hypothetical protein